MNAAFQELMSRAAQQTRGGDLMGATASIQAALAGKPAPDAPQAADDVIDVEARVIDDRPAEIGSPLQQEAPTRGRTPVMDEERFLAASFTHDRLTVDYKLYVPPGDASAPRPLLLMLHGCTQDADDFALGTQMNEVARQHGWMVLYPSQSAPQNAQGCWNWFKPNHQQRGRGEPALLSALTRHVMDQHAVDARHVHVAGLSAGGAMAAVLAQSYPDVFASAGVHSGLPSRAVKNAVEAMSMMRSGQQAAGASLSRPDPTAQPVPTIVFHGTRDMTVNPLNGELVYQAAMAGQAGEERIENGREGGRAYTRKSFVAPDGRTVAELWLIEGAGHAWSGGDRRGSHTDWQGPNAAEQMLCFFSAHPRRLDA